jgi:hypothetical protein
MWGEVGEETWIGLGRASAQRGRVGDGCRAAGDAFFYLFVCRSGQVEGEQAAVGRSERDDTVSEKVNRPPRGWNQEGRCIHLITLHRPFYKQDPKEKENYKEV